MVSNEMGFASFIKHNQFQTSFVPFLRVLPFEEEAFDQRVTSLGQWKFVLMMTTKAVGDEKVGAQFGLCMAAAAVGSTSVAVAGHNAPRDPLKSEQPSDGQNCHGS